MRARLKIEAGEGSPASFDLAPGQPATLGRSRDSSLVLKDDLASRLHAKVYFEDGRWVVRDFGLNGTKVNGLKVSGAAELNDGSVIQIGDAVVRFHTVAGSAITPPPSSSRGTLSNPLSGIKTATDHRTPAPTDHPQATRTGFNIDRFSPRPSEAEVNASQLKVDELTALCRFMTAAVETKDAHELIRLALRAIVNQTTAKVAGYLNLDPNDPTPRFILPDTAAVDTTLSRRLTERVRNERKTIWLFNDSAKGDVRPPTESLFAYQDALCLPLAAKGDLYAAVHVYRTGSAFADRDARFIEAVAGYLGKSLELHRHRRKLEAENNRLRAAVPTADELIGDSNAMMTLRQQTAKAAPLPFTVLIHGESGSGKELVAQAVHRQSPRAAGPLVVVNCAAIAPTLLEAELFGYRKGAFSGADRDHPGLFEQADEGTLFLDEVGELSLDCQAKLLRVIEGKPFRPVGGTKDVKVDVRVVAATHRDLDREVKANKFRQDLLFRLKVIPLKVPPLREHAEDIAELAGFFLERLSVQCRKTFHLKPAAVRKLQAYSWPGNVRQLRAVLESAAVMCETDTIDAGDLAITSVSEAAPSTGNELPNSLAIDDLETWAIRKALKQTSGNVSRASQILGMSRDTLHTKLKKKGIARDEVLADGDAG